MGWTRAHTPRTLYAPHKPDTFHPHVTSAPCHLSPHATLSQYGDTFVEILRLEMLVQVVLPRVLIVLGYPVVPFLKRFLQEDVECDCVELMKDYGWLHSVCNTDHARAHRAALPLVYPVPATEGQREARRADMRAMDSLRYDIGHCVEAYQSTVVKSLARRCTNSDPNYGTVWFHCRQKPYETPASVVKNALHILTCEMTAAQPVYVRAVMWYVRRAIMTGAGPGAGAARAGDGVEGSEGGAEGGPGRCGGTSLPPSSAFEHFSPPWQSFPA